jgi:FkbM family methyltransferase
MKKLLKKILLSLSVKCLKHLDPGLEHRRKSYAQCGEDLIMSLLFHNVLEMKNITYLDIGAHDPVQLSNTCLFYEMGGHGVCVEPDPDLCAIIAKARSRDVCLNVGVGGTKREKAKLYIAVNKLCNTFSQDVALELAQGKIESVDKVVEIDIVPINEIMANFFDPWPNLISIDTEGMDLEIIRSIDFDKYRPEVFCIETLTSTLWDKIPEIESFMKSMQYCVFADTQINTIFVEQSVWEKAKVKREALFSSSIENETQIGSRT